MVSGKLPVSEGTLMLFSLFLLFAAALLFFSGFVLDGAAVLHAAAWGCFALSLTLPLVPRLLK